MSTPTSAPAAPADSRLRTPFYNEIRCEGHPAAIVLLHGFGGDVAKTWGQFPDFLAAAPALAGWDIVSLGYNTHFMPDILKYWRADASIQTLATYFRTAVKQGPLQNHTTLAVVAHSMGGLVVQQALIDDAELERRLSHVFFFGTPSIGVSPKLGLLARFKKPVEEMLEGSDFIRHLHGEWMQRFADAVSVLYWVIAGDLDEFVPRASSLDPFPDARRGSVPGTHREMVKPKHARDLCVELVVSGLTDGALMTGPLNSALVAIERKDFQTAVRKLEPIKHTLDKYAQVSFALALDGVGRTADAIAYLESCKEHSTDARGTLAGRLKRRWLLEPVAADGERALALYQDGYNEAVTRQDAAQAFYLGINVAFMLVAYCHDDEAAQRMAREVLGHCAVAQEDLWSLATQGEAHLQLGHDDTALAFYDLALQHKPEPWQARSMYMQATYLATRFKRPELPRRLAALFWRYRRMMEPLCFVLMPFGRKPDATGLIIDFDAIYETVIAPAIRDAGMQPLRADEEQAGGVIHKAMFERLVLCEFAVADLTTANANVFYELGVRHAARPHTTLLTYCRSCRLPFDAAPLRGIPYDLDAQGHVSDPADLQAAITRGLRAAMTDACKDSPLYQLLNDYPNIKHEKTDVFRERVRYSTAMKARLAEARRTSLAAMQSVAAELEPIEQQEAPLLVDLLLSYRALKAWEEMVALVKRMPPHLAATVLVQEQKAFALNRCGQRAEAEDTLLELIRQRGPSSETYGLLGRVYKDRRADALRDGQTALAAGWLRKAVEAYRAGFEADWRDAYPGVNAVTLMEICDPPDPRQSDLLPVVLFAVKRRLATGTPDYWDYATLLELAVLARDPGLATAALPQCLAAARESWEPETTAGNLRLIRETRSGRGDEVGWIEACERELLERARQMTKPGA